MRGLPIAFFYASMARTILATTRKMLQGAIKRDAWLEIMVAWAETPVANHELLLSCFDFIAKMMAEGVSISRVVAGANRVVTGAGRVVTGANRAVAGANRVVAGANRVVTGASRVVAGVNRVVMGASRVVVEANRVMTGASRVVAERNCPDAVVSTDFRGALSVVASLIMALVNVISMKIFCHVCVFY